MRTVQGVALDGFRARVRALAGRTGTPVRRAPAGALRPAGPTAGPAPAGLRGSVRESLPRALSLVRDLVPARDRRRARARTPHASAADLRALRDRRGDAPVLVRARSGRLLLVLLAPGDLSRFYAEPLSVLGADRPPPAGAGCAHAEPGGDQPGTEAQVLAAADAVHPACGTFLAAVAEEARHLTACATLDLARTRYAVGRAARRIVLGDAAAADAELADWLGQSRARGAARAAHRIREYARHAGPGTLLGQAARNPDPSAADPAGQARQWLLAMDALPATLLRTLLLLGAHPAEQDAAAAEAAGDPARGELRRLRACVRESLRLYPVVPDLIRTTHTETRWRGVPYPAGTSVLLPAAFHQRDPERVPAAHAFVPGRWKNPDAERDLRMAPFGHGEGRCPGAELGLLVTAAFCAEVLRGHRVGRSRPVLDPVGPLPAHLDPDAVRLTLVRR
ncbi:cytochrome P450 [Streptomyces sp. cmx-4-9]|uniref:cytochrome P450 n=1 Tax=Streptomyces sp. cmx-4-9 TaxID=2790941 RepID=UPI0039812542